MTPIKGKGGENGKRNEKIPALGFVDCNRLLSNPLNPINHPNLHHP